jgi:pimeloyl-ACP methyl ester carboxylesterase
VRGFADVTRAKCEHLGITKVAAVVGTSGGGPTAVAMAAWQPDLVERLLGGLSTLPARDVVAALRAEDRAWLLALFTRMRSGRGFLNDLRATPDATAAAEVGQPTLVIASDRRDRPHRPPTEGAIAPSGSRGSPQLLHSESPPLVAPGTRRARHNG